MAKIHDVRELIEVLRAPDGGAARLARVVASGELQLYLETRSYLDWPLRQQLAALLERLNDRVELALFALRYALTEDPLELVPGVAVSSPSEIVPLVAAGAPERETVLGGLRGLAADGRLSEWLRLLSVEGGEGVVEAMEAVHRAYPNEPDLPIHALLWRLAPDLGFPVPDGWLKTPKELAAWIDADSQHRARALELLDRGWIPVWLFAVGRLDRLQGLAETVSMGPTQGARAELLTRLLDPDLSDPQVFVEPTRLDLSLSEGSGESTATVMLTSRGRGHVWGDVDLRGAIPGLSLVSKDFDGTPARIAVRVAPAEMTARPRDPSLVIRVKSGGPDRTMEVPIRIRVRGSLRSMLQRAFSIGAPAARRAHLASPGSRLGTSLLFGLSFGAVMGLFRVVLGMVMPGGSITEGFDWVSYEHLESFVFSFGEQGGSDEDRLANPFIWFGISFGILLVVTGSIAGFFWAVSQCLRGCRP